MKKTGLLIGAICLLFSVSASAANYKIDVKGAHAFITFKINHLGYSWLLGRFNEFDGEFYYDAEKPEASSINVVIKTASVDSNHAERDKHLRAEEFLNVKKYPEARFVSKKFDVKDANNAEVTGDFTLNGVTREIRFPVQKVGEGIDPWKGYRVGFTGTTELKLADYNITRDLGPASTHVILELNIEGIRQ